MEEYFTLERKSKIGRMMFGSSPPVFVFNWVHWLYRLYHIYDLYDLWHPHWMGPEPAADPRSPGSSGRGSWTWRSDACRTRPACPGRCGAWETGWGCCDWRIQGTKTWQWWGCEARNYTLVWLKMMETPQESEGWRLRMILCHPVFEDLNYAACTLFESWKVPGRQLVLCKGP